MESDTDLSSTPALTTTLRDDAIAVIALDVPGETMNVLRAAILDEAAEVFERLSHQRDLRGVLFRSGKPGTFIAGADIDMLANCKSSDEATALSRDAQALYARIAAFPVPVVAVIDGPCLGGGLELALACHGRIASDRPETIFALPEVQLGLLPGSGATQRLPRLIGIANALDMMLTGRRIGASRARHLGLVDAVVPVATLERAALLQIDGKQPRRQRRRTWTERLLETTPPGRRLLFRKVRKQAQQRSRSNYPAPERIIDCVEVGYRDGSTEGYRHEADCFGQLAMTSQARQLMYLHFATVALKKDTGTAADVVPLSVRRVAVIGAGLMGAGISFVTSSRAGLPVRLCDVSAESLRRAVHWIHGQIDARYQRGSVTQFDAFLQSHRITPTTALSGVSQVELLIEAVPEKRDLKASTLADLDQRCSAETIFATNTSSIPVRDLAAATSRPDRVLGMHYFSPVERMPLLEVVVTPQTSATVVATAVALGRAQGKTVIVVGDGAGFYVNRILAPYLNEAGQLLADGVAIDRIDEALVDFGFPMGPFALLDQVGLDVSASVGAVLHEAYGERMQPPALMRTLLSDGRLGKKTGQGFYRYEKRHGRRRAWLDKTIYRRLNIQPDNTMDPGSIAERCVLAMVNEAARCLADEVLRCPRDGDIGAVYGFGFPPFLGGPFRYMDSLGPDQVVVRLEALARQQGQRFAPAPALVETARGKRRFHSD